MWRMLQLWVLPGWVPRVSLSVTGRWLGTGLSYKHHLQAETLCEEGRWCLAMQMARTPGGHKHLALGVGCNEWGTQPHWSWICPLMAIFSPWFSSEHQDIFPSLLQNALNIVVCILYCWLGTRLPWWPTGRRRTLSHSTTAVFPIALCLQAINSLQQGDLKPVAVSACINQREDA